MTGLIEKSVRTSLKPVDSVLGTEFTKKPPAPAKETTPVLPDEEALTRSKRRETARRFTLGSGRVSTILSDPSERLGG